jgi:hypothetical protein
MRPLTGGLLLLTLFAGFLLGGVSGLAGLTGAAAAAQVVTPIARSPIALTATVGGGALATLVPGTQVPGVVPRTTGVPVPAPDSVAATRTAAIATIAAADVTATARPGATLTSIAATATRFAQGTSTPLASPTALATPTGVVTVSASPSATATATVVPIGTADPLATSREVFITVPLVIGDERLEAGTTVQIPRGLVLVNGAIPAGTPIRTPSGTTLSIPTGTRITAVDAPTSVPAPLNATLPQSARLGDQSYPADTTIVLPTDTVVLGSLEPGATVLLRPGAVVQVAGRMVTLAEPLSLVVTGAPVAQPATLPRTGDAAPVLWPMGLGLVLVLVGWRLRRAN